MGRWMYDKKDGWWSLKGKKGGKDEAEGFAGRGTSVRIGCRWGEEEWLLEEGGALIRFIVRGE